MKKVSQAQANVIDCLMENKGSYIVKSPYYNHNRVVSEFPFMRDGYESRELMQFTRPTLTVLIRLGAIKLKDGNVYTFNQ